MIEKSSFTMPKAAFFILYLFCGNFILSGKTADQCPKNPLAPTNSISGMVVGVIVGTEKVVNGVMSYFWYLGENSVNQILSVSSQLEGYLSQLTIKIQNFASGLVAGIGGQLKTIYNGSSGSIRLLFDSIIKLENSAQSFAYKQVQSFSDKVVSGKLTGEITSVIKSPISSLGKGLKKAKNSVSKLSANVGNEVKKSLAEMVDSVKTSGIPSDIKGILGAPLRGVQEFSKEAQSVIQTVKNETSERFSGYSSEFKKGGVIDKIVAVGSFPVGVGMEIWSFGLKISDAAMKSVSVSTKDIVQPFLGPILTERLGTLVMLPMKVTEGFYKSTLNFFSNIGGIISKITGGGRVSVQINMVIKHPITILQNLWTTTKQELKDFSKATLGEGLTDQLSSALSSPEKAISSFVSSLMNSQLGSLIYTPMMYLEKGFSQIKMTLRGISKGIIGKKWTSRLSNVLNAPMETISHFTASITGGGSLGDQIKTVLSSPLQTIEKTWTVLKNKTEEILTSITGGGSLSTQISTVLTKPVTLFKNLWSTTKKTVGDLSKSLVGEGLTAKIGQTISSPLSSLSNMTASITGGGSLGTQIETIFTKPFEIVQNLWQKTKNSTKSLSKTLLGGKLTSSLSKLASSPLSVASELYKSFSSKLSGLLQGFGASINISAGGSGGGGVGGAISSLIQAPMDFVKGTLKGAEKAGKSLMNSLKGFYQNLPIIGKGGSVKASVKIGGEGTGASMSLGGEAKDGSEKDASPQGKVSAEAKARRRRSSLFY